MIEKLNISKHSRRIVKHQPLRITLLNIKWDHFEILTTGRSDIHLRIKESLLIKDLKPSSRWLKTVSSTFQDVDFDGSLLPLFIS